MLRWASGAHAATLVQRGSSSRDRRYLLAQVEKYPTHPRIVEACFLALRRRCLLPLRPREREQILIGFADYAISRCEPASPSPYQRRSMPARAGPRQLGSQDLPG